MRIPILMNIKQRELCILMPTHLNDAYKMAWNSIKI